MSPQHSSPEHGSLEQPSLEQSTAELLAAIQAEDLEAIGRALEVRATATEHAIASGEVSIEALQAGERAMDELMGLKQKWAVESSRLGQMRLGFGRGGPGSTSIHDWRG